MPNPLIYSVEDDTLNGKLDIVRLKLELTESTSGSIFDRIEVFSDRLEVLCTVTPDEAEETEITSVVNEHTGDPIVLEVGGYLEDDGPHSTIKNEFVPGPILSVDPLQGGSYKIRYAFDWFVGTKRTTIDYKVVVDGDDVIGKGVLPTASTKRTQNSSVMYFAERSFSIGSHTVQLFYASGTTNREAGVANVRLSLERKG